MNNILVNREPKPKSTKESKVKSMKAVKGKEGKDTNEKVKRKSNKNSEETASKFNYFNKSSLARSIIIILEMVAVMVLFMWIIGCATFYFKSWTIFFLLSFSSISMLIMIVKVDFIFVFSVRLMSICFIIFYIYLSYQLTKIVPVDNIGAGLIIGSITALSLYTHVYFLKRENALQLF